MVDFIQTKAKIFLNVLKLVGIILFLYPMHLSARTIQISSNTLEIIPLKDTVETLVEKENYQKAIDIIQDSKENFRKQKNWIDYTESTVLLSELTGYMDLNLMLQNADQALQDIQTYQLENELLIATAKFYKAIALAELNQKEKVVQLFEESAPILIKHKIWKKITELEYYLAVHYLGLKDYSNARIHIKKGLDIGNLHNTKNFETFLLNVLSIVNYREGDYQKAIKSTLNIIENQEQISNPNSQDKIYLSRNYHSLGSFYTNKGELKRALACYTKINEIFAFDEHEIIKHFPRYFNNIGKILIKQKEFEESLVFFKKSLSFKSVNSKKDKKTLQNLVQDYNTLAYTWYELENTDSLIFYAYQSLAIPVNYQKHYSYLYLALAYLNLNDAPQALTNLKKSQQAYYKNQGVDKNYDIILYKKYGEVYDMVGAYQQAAEYHQKSLILSVGGSVKDTTDIYTHPFLKNIIFPIGFLNSLQSKAKTLTKLSSNQKDQQAALETYQLATQWIDSLQNSYVLEGSQLFWSDKFKEIYEEAITLNHQFYEKTREAKYLKNAFDLTEKSKALLLLEGLKDNEGQNLASLPDSLTQKEKDLKIAVAFYEKSLQTATEKKQKDRIQLYQSYLADNRLQLARLKEQMEQDYPTYYALKYANSTISIPEIQANILENQQVFINYFLGNQQSYAFVIGKDFQKFIPLVSTDTLHQKGQAFLKLLKDPSLVQQNAKLAFQNYNQAAFAVYKSIIQPILDKVPSATNQLLISPDGILNQIPFAALTTAILPQQTMDFGKLPYLLHRYPIHYAYSANLLWNNRTTQEKIASNNQILAYAPSYKSNGPIAELRGGSADLVGTKSELTAIAQYFDGLFENNDQATKNSFQTNASNYGLLHLAMHGESHPTKGAHLIFTDLNQTEKDAHFLHDYEIANMDLTAQLAVLSACETGVGEYVQGEGVFSLARSFMYAGVPSIAMSLWQVNDLTTSQIMPEFYQNLSNGQTKAKSLHQAKQQFLATAELEYRHPYYWSGFVLLGDGQVLKSESLFGGWFWGLGLSFMLIGAWGYFRIIKR